MSDRKNPGRRRMKKRTMYAIILVVMFVCILMIGFLLLFQVRSIEVEGNRYLSQQEIMDWIEEDEMSSNAVSLIIKHRFLKHDLLPAMEKAKVSLKNPWTVHVKVTEKRVVGYVELGDDCVYFDKDGIVLAQTTEWWDDVPCIEGFPIEKVSIYKPLPIGEEYKKIFENLLEMSQSLKKYELVPDRIVCADRGLYLFLGQVCAALGDDDFGDKIAQIPPILAKLGEQGGTLHLEEYNDSNTTISFEKDVLPELPAPQPEETEEVPDDIAEGDQVEETVDSGEDAASEQ